MRQSTLLLLVVLVSAVASSAFGLTLDSQGNVTDWGVTPFPQTGSTPGNHAGWAPSGSGVHWVEQNNYSPVDYPSGTGHQPSPGGNTGEEFDLEAMYWRLSGSNLQVMVVTSMPRAQYSSGHHRWYRLGDLFIDVDGNGWDVGIATTDSAVEPWRNYEPGTNQYTTFDHSATPGTAYRITDEDQLVGILGNQGGFGRDSDIYPFANPWVVDQALATELGLVTLVTGQFDYGKRWGGGFYPDDEYYPGGKKRDEDGTWFYEYTIPLGMVDPLNYLAEDNLGGLGLHLTIECGNDVVGNAWDNINPPGGGDVIPEAGTLAAVMMACGGLVGYLRRRRTS